LLDHEVGAPALEAVISSAKASIYALASAVFCKSESIPALFSITA